MYERVKVAHCWRIEWTTLVDGLDSISPNFTALSSWLTTRTLLLPLLKDRLLLQWLLWNLRLLICLPPRESTSSWATIPNSRDRLCSASSNLSASLSMELCARRTIRYVYRYEDPWIRYLRLELRWQFFHRSNPTTSSKLSLLEVPQPNRLPPSNTSLTSSTKTSIC